MARLVLLITPQPELLARENRRLRSVIKRFVTMEMIACLVASTSLCAIRERLFESFSSGDRRFSIIERDQGRCQRGVSSSLRA